MSSKFSWLFFSTLFLGFSLAADVGRAQVSPSDLSRAQQALSDFFNWAGAAAAKGVPISEVQHSLASHGNALIQAAQIPGLPAEIKTFLTEAGSNLYESARTVRSRSGQFQGNIPRQYYSVGLVLLLALNPKEAAEDLKEGQRQLRKIALGFAHNGPLFAVANVNHYDGNGILKSEFASQAKGQQGR